jgi:hypothetical protein
MDEASSVSVFVSDSVSGLESRRADGRPVV